MTVVDLTGSEMAEAALCGVLRQIGCIKRKEGGSWENQVERALAERALAKHMDVYHDVRSGNLVGGYHVTVQPEETAKLYVSGDTPETYRHVLLIGQYGVYRIAGHIGTNEAMKEEWKVTGGSAETAIFAVSQEDLIDFA